MPPIRPRLLQSTDLGDVANGRDGNGHDKDDRKDPVETVVGKGVKDGEQDKSFWFGKNCLE